MSYFGVIFFANMRGGGGQDYFSKKVASKILLADHRKKDRKNSSLGARFGMLEVDLAKNLGKSSIP